LSLKEASLMYDVLPGTLLAIYSSILAGHNEESDRTRSKHVFQHISDSVACSCADFICLNRKPVLFMKVVFEIPPLRITTVSDEYDWSAVVGTRVRRHHGYLRFRN